MGEELGSSLSCITRKIVNWLHFQGEQFDKIYQNVKSICPLSPQSTGSYSAVYSFPVASVTDCHQCSVYSNTDLSCHSSVAQTGSAGFFASGLPRLKSRALPPGLLQGGSRGGAISRLTQGVCRFQFHEVTALRPLLPCWLSRSQLSEAVHTPWLVVPSTLRAGSGGLRPSPGPSLSGVPSLLLPPAGKAHVIRPYPQRLQDGLPLSQSGTLILLSTKSPMPHKVTYSQIPERRA